MIQPDELLKQLQQFESQPLPPRKPENYVKKKQASLAGPQDPTLNGLAQLTQSQHGGLLKHSVVPVSQDQEIKKCDQIIKLMQNFHNLKSYLQEIYSTSMEIIQQKNDQTQSQEIQLQRQKHQLVRQQIEMEELLEKNGMLEELNQELSAERKEDQEKEKEKRFDQFEGKIYSTDVIQQLQQQHELQQDRLKEITDHFYNQNEAAQADKMDNFQEDQKEIQKNQDTLRREIEEQQSEMERDSRLKLKAQQLELNGQQSVQYATLRREVDTLTEALRCQADKHILEMMRLREDSEAKSKRKVAMVMSQLQEKEELQSRFEEQIDRLEMKLNNNSKTQFTYKKKNMQLLTEIGEKDMRAELDKEQIEQLCAELEMLRQQQGQAPRPERRERPAEVSYYAEEEQRSTMQGVMKLMNHLQDIQASVSNGDQLDMSYEPASLMGMGNMMISTDQRLKLQDQSYMPIRFDIDESIRNRPQEQMTDQLDILTVSSKVVTPDKKAELMAYTPIKEMSEKKEAPSTAKFIGGHKVEFIEYFDNEDLNSDVSGSIDFNSMSKGSFGQEQPQKVDPFTFIDVNSRPQPFPAPPPRSGLKSTAVFNQKSSFDELLLSHIEPQLSLLQPQPEQARQRQGSWVHDQKKKVVKDKYTEYKLMLSNLETLDPKSTQNSRQFEDISKVFGFLNDLINQRMIISDSLISKSMINLKSQKLAILNQHQKIRIEIVDYTIKADQPTFYEIQIHDKLLNQVWSVITRYSELLKIHKLMKESVAINDKSLLKKLPNFPKQHRFSLKSKKQFQSNRVQEFNDYLYELFILKPQFVDHSIYNDFFYKKIYFQKAQELEELRSKINSKQQQYNKDKKYFMASELGIEFNELFYSIHEKFQKEMALLEIDEAFRLISLQQKANNQEQMLGESILNHSRLGNICEFEEYRL